MFIYQTEKRDQYYKKVLHLHNDKGYGRKRIAKLIPEVAESTIRRWIANFEAENGIEKPLRIMKKPQVNTSEPPRSSEVEELQKRVKELEAQLERTEIKAEFYDRMIDIAEAKFKIPIRKKAGAKQ